MSAYWAVFTARFRMLLQYRAAAAAGVATQVFFGLVRIMIFHAFYRAATGPQPMTFAQVITYVWLGQGLIHLIPFRADYEVMAMVRSGAIVYELARPVDLYGLWYARSLATRTAPTLLRAVPLFAIAALAGPLAMAPPASAGALAAFLASLVLAVALTSALSTLITLTSLWTISGEGAAMLLMSAAWFFSGMIVPVPLLPDALRTVAWALPFRGIMDLPFRLYMGHLAPIDALPVAAIQLAWTVALVALGRVLAARGVRRLVVQGG